MEPTIAVVLEVLIPIAFTGVFLAAIVGAVLFGRKQQEKAMANLTAMANSLGLDLVVSEKRALFGSSPPRLNGVLRGRAVQVYSYTTGSGKSRQVWCALSAAVDDSSGLTLRISGENVLTRIGRTFGARELVVGDEAFDSRFWIKTNDPDYMRVALLPEVRSRFLENWNAGATGSISVENGEVKYVEQGFFSDAKRCDRFVAMAGLVCDIGEIVEVHRRRGSAI